MTMTTSRKVAKSVRTSALPDLIGRWSEAELERVNREMLADLRDTVADLPSQQRLPMQVVLLAARSAAMELKFTALAEMAFERIAKLESNLRAERKAKALPYAGAWKQGDQYEAGQFVTYQGSIWHVEKRNRSRPGDDPAAYTLACKAGRDGKDARP